MTRAPLAESPADSALPGHRAYEDSVRLDTGELSDLEPADHSLRRPVVRRRPRQIDQRMK